MVTQDLIDSVAQKFLKGERREQINEELMAEGWEEKDIDEAVSHIQRTALENFPLYNTYKRVKEKIEANLLNLSVKAQIGFFILIAALLAILVFVLNRQIAQFDHEGGTRDEQRKQDLSQIASAMDTYYFSNRFYPFSLQQLVPVYIQSIPVDPKTKQPYAYLVSEDRSYYELCVQFEKTTRQCISSQSQVIIPQSL